MSYRLFAVEGWGSVLVECMLTLCNIVPDIEDVAGFDQPGAARDRLLAFNPLAQLPTLILPDGQVMTESAAIALLLAERHPASRLAPALADSSRPQFLRRLVWLVANLYPTFTYGDYPERWVRTEPDDFKTTIDAYRQSLWLQFEADVAANSRPQQWILGERFSALDIYVAVMTHWRPGRPWFEQHCPRLHAIALRTEALPELAAVLKRNFAK